jgi:ribosomal-protein-alanine N-acetyltransferase
LPQWSRGGDNGGDGGNGFTVLTTRLELIAATAETVSLELRNVVQFATALGVPVPASWPPPLNDEGSQRWYLEMLQRPASAVGWALWYLIRREPTRELVGVAGFKGRPVNGSCEIGYSLLPSFQGNGYATEASRELIRWAFSHRDVEQVTSETLRDLLDSIRVMEKCGMRFIGDGNPEAGQRTVRYAVDRAEFRAVVEEITKATEPTDSQTGERRERRRRARTHKH